MEHLIIDVELEIRTLTRFSCLLICRPVSSRILAKPAPSSNAFSAQTGTYGSTCPTNRRESWETLDSIAQELPIGSEPSFA